MTPMEGRSLVRGGIVLLLLALVRVAASGPGAPGPVLEGEGDGDDLGALLAESREARDEARRRARPLEKGEGLDPNRASEEELDRLPGVGPATAEAMVEHRKNHGGFARAEDLLAVRGIGPATLEKIRPFLDFSRGPPLELRRQAGRPPGGASGKSSGRAPGTIDVNRAAAVELEALPGIGPTLARRIVESRQREGPFLAPEDLLRVRGIGPRSLERIRNRIRMMP